MSDVFPLEIRAFAIAIFYTIGTLGGGVGASLLFGLLLNGTEESRLHAAMDLALS